MNRIERERSSIWIWTIVRPVWGPRKGRHTLDFRVDSLGRRGKRVSAAFSNDRPKEHRRCCQVVRGFPCPGLGSTMSVRWDIAPIMELAYGTRSTKDVQLRSGAIIAIARAVLTDDYENAVRQTQNPCFPGQSGIARMQERSPFGSILYQREGPEDVGDCSHTAPLY